MTLLYEYFVFGVWYANPTVVIPRVKGQVQLRRTLIDCVLCRHMTPG